MPQTVFSCLTFLSARSESVQLCISGVPKANGFDYALLVTGVSEIKAALRKLPPRERWEIACWLLKELPEGNLGNAEGRVASDSGGQTAPLPDYSARRRRIFGRKILPNMVLLSRAEEPW
jgi:hypothetical protein